MRIGIFAKRAGLTAHTIRYYERIGLLPPADRHPSGVRDYDETALVWVDFLRRLKSTGMPLSDMRAYAVLRQAGPGTETERHDQLVQHRAMVRANVADLNAALAVLDAKIATYATSLEREQTRETEPTR